MTRERFPRLEDPLVALHVVDGHAKRLSRDLDTARAAGRQKRVDALLREQAYLYTLKDWAVQVLLDEGLLVEGDSPLGRLGFHVPPPGFEEQARGGATGQGVGARVVASQYRVEDAITVLIRLVMWARLQKRQSRAPRTQRWAASCGCRRHFAARVIAESIKPGRGRTSSHAGTSAHRVLASAAVSGVRVLRFRSHTRLTLPAE